MTGLTALVVIMVMLTTLITPPALKWSLTRGERSEKGRESTEESGRAAA